MAKPSIPDALGYMKMLTLRKIRNKGLLRLSYFLSRILKRHIHWGFPESLSIEPTSFCNLHCPECPAGNNQLKRNRTFLSLDDYRSIIDEHDKYLIYVQLFFQGEPLLHPHFAEMVRYARQRKIHVSTSTNAQLLTPALAEKLVTAGLNRIIISIDGTTQEVYEQYRKGGSLNLAINGLENIVKAKKRCGSTLPFIELQFVVFRSNEHQINDVLALGKRLGADKVSIKTAQLSPFASGHPSMPAQDKYSRYQKREDGTYALKREKTFYCKRVWISAVVNAENQLLPCCFDKSAEFPLGSLSIQRVRTITKLQTTKKFRERVWFAADKPEICSNCTEGLKHG